MLSFIPINMTCTKVSSRRSVTKPSRSKHAKPTTSSASTTRCGNASHASSATPYPSPRRWRTTSVPSSSLFATTTWRKRQHYLCSTTHRRLREGLREHSSRARWQGEEQPQSRTHPKNNGEQEWWHRETSWREFRTLKGRC